MSIRDCLGSILYKSFLAALLLTFVLSSSVFVTSASAINLKNEVMSLMPKELYQPMKPKQAPEIYGPTPANAQLGNQGLSVQLRKTGTVSVFAWPRPSMYDQVKMHTSSREDGRLWGAAENAGQFFGLRVEDKYRDGEKCTGYMAFGNCIGGEIVPNYETRVDVTFLRSSNWDFKQTYTDPFNDVVKTDYENTKYDNLEVTVRDFVPLNENVSTDETGKPGNYTGYGHDEALDGDALIRKVAIDGERNIERKYTADTVTLFSYSNFNMTKNHHPYVPTSDWAEPLTKTEDAVYKTAGDWDKSGDAIYHYNQDRKDHSQVIAMGFGHQTPDHDGQVGYDNIACVNATDFDCWANFVISGSISLFDKDKVDGAYKYFTKNKKLNSEWTNDGKDNPSPWAPTLRDFFTSTGLESEKLNPGNNPTENVVIVAENNEDDARSLLKDARDIATDDWNDAVDAKEEWFKYLARGGSNYGSLPLPNTTNDEITKLSKRSIVTLIQNYDPKGRTEDDKLDHGGAIVASVARQSPYGEDWPRDGYYFNYVLDHQLGLHDWVERRNRWYQELQQKPDKNYPNDFPDQPLVPAGNWAMNYYGNGVEGGIIPWEIDETGYMVKAFWDHFEVTDDRKYLSDIYPALKRSADFLVQFKDPNNNLQKKGHEDDHLHKSQTMVGAQSTWMGLQAAEKAAEELGKNDDAERYRQRRKELGRAINELLWNKKHNAWGRKHLGIAEIVWPVKFRDYSNERVQQHLRTSWDKIEKTFQTFEDPSSAPDSLKNDQGVVTGLYETKFLIALAKAGVKDSKVQDSLGLIADKWATEGTYLMGEVWMRGDDNPFGSSEYGDDRIVTTVSQPHAWEQCLFYLAAVNSYGM